MKRLTFLFIAMILFSSNESFGQQNVGIGTLTPNTNAILDLSSNNKGFLAPRMTSAERTLLNLSATDEGLIVFDTNLKLYHYWDGAQWVAFPGQQGSNNISLNYDATTGTLSLTDNGGTLTTNIPPDNDSDPANELITNIVFGAGNILTIDEGGNTWSTTINVNDADSDPTNELNNSFDFNTTSNILSITDVGGTLNADLSSLATPLQVISSNNTATNTDVTVTLTLGNSTTFNDNDWQYNGSNLYNLNSGNVGINSNNPLVKLDVQGTNPKATTATTEYLIQAKSNNPAPLALRMGIKTDATATNRYGAIEVDDNGVKRHLVLQPTAGNVGIGIVTPGYPLEVSGGVQSVINTGRFFTTGIPNLTEMTPVSTQSPTIAIKANNAVWSTAGFYSSSDIRAKEYIHSAAKNESLAIINQLNVVKYNWVDKTKSAKNYEEGFIAQEVEKIMPEAVTKTKEFIPNIYQLADSYEFIIENEILIVISTTTGLMVGDKIKMYAENGNEFYGFINGINDNQLTISTTESLDNNIGRIFLYGKEVHDFHTVDYDRVFTVGIAAIQELSKQNDVRKNEIEFLKIENEKLKNELDRIGNLEAQVDYLKEIILINAKK